ncbi:MAG: hypothetical protein Q8R69_14565 [Telluria sp.]|nr:hypothetical protein [Telluria sp.]
MDITRFEQLARDPRRTRADLESMKANALAKGLVEFAKIANEVLLERFSVVTKRGGGRTPTTATFRSRSEYFESGKDAYVWLVEQFCQFRKDTLENYISLHRRAGTRSKGCRFAKNPDDLFPENSSRRGNPSHYIELISGWYADTNLNHKDKFAALMQLSYVCKLEYSTDWDFRVTGATEELLEHQEAVIRAREILEELLAL